MLDRDDRVEMPEGVEASFDVPGHLCLAGTPPRWPALLGYNQLIAKPGATVVARHGTDPLLVVGEVGRGRSAAFASDLAPHWAPPEFVAWEHYPAFWVGLLCWTAGRTAPSVPSDDALLERSAP